MYIKAKLLEFVRADFANAKKAIAKKRDDFKASERWLIGFCDRKGLSYRKRTNKKSRSAIMRSLKVRKFHWFAIYKVRKLPSKRSDEWKRMVEEEHPLTL